MGRHRTGPFVTLALAAIIAFIIKTIAEDVL